MLNADISNSRAALAASSALSFPAIPTWLGSQQYSTFLPDKIKEWCFSSIVWTIGQSHLALFIAWRDDSESDKTR
jgi:hypothetical protein